MTRSVSLEKGHYLIYQLNKYTMFLTA